MSSLLDHHLIAERYFFPRWDAVPEPFVVDCGDARLACSWHVIDVDALTVLHFHGNGEVVADYAGDFVDAIASMGFNLFLAEYRGYGGSSGTPAMGAMLRDVEAIVGAIGVPPERLVAFGRSVGSIYAIHCAHLFGEIAGLIIESGIADVHERLRLRVDPGELGCTEADLRAAVDSELDHEGKLGAYGGPALFLHAAFDHLIDPSHARRNHRWAGGDNKLVIFPAGDHNSILAYNWEAYMAEVAAFLKALRP